MEQISVSCSSDMTKMVIPLENQPELATSAETVWVQPLPNGNYTMQNGV